MEEGKDWVGLFDVLENTNVLIDHEIISDTVAERLRRSTRNRLGVSRVGSSPASVDVFTAQSFFSLCHVAESMIGVIKTYLDLLDGGS